MDAPTKPPASKRSSPASCPDRLARDDHAEAVLPAQIPVKVEVVAPANGFLDAALRSLDSVEWKRTWPIERLGPAQPGNLYVFYRCLPPPGFTAAATILIDPAASGYWGQLRGAIDQPLVSDFQRESPLLRHVGIEKVSLQKAREFVPAPGAEIFAESFGKPLIFGQWKGDRRWLVLPFDLESSDLVLRTAFPILLGNIVESLRREADIAAPPPLPGPVESALKRTVPDDVRRGRELPGAIDVAWWSGYPLWWWAVCFGACWLLAEWWSLLPAHHRVRLSWSLELTHPGFLCALLGLGFIVWWHRHTLAPFSPRRKLLSSILRSAIFVFVVLALTEPRWMQQRRETHVIWLVDVSRSVGGVPPSRPRKSSPPRPPG